MLRWVACLLLVVAAVAAALRVEAQSSAPYRASGSAAPGSAGKPSSPAAAADRASPAPPAPSQPVAFGVASVEVAAERDQPQLCFAFTEPLQRATPRGPRYGDLVSVKPDLPHSIVVRDNSLCIDGFAHGQPYDVTLAAGLPAASGAKLAAEDRRTGTIPNRKPTVAFRNGGYIRSRVGADGLPLRSINVERVRLQVLRVKDRALVERVYNGKLNQTLSDFEMGNLLDASGEVVWRGEMAVGNQLNQPVVTAFPVDAVLGALTPGVYIAVASDAQAPADTWEFRVTQWFVVSDIGLTSFMGEDGLTVVARSMEQAAPLAGVELRLMGRNNAELGKLVTGTDGAAHFSMAQLRPEGAEPPQALYASSAAGDFSFLDLGAPAVDLTRRGAAGRPAPGTLDAYLFTDRADYRRGERVRAFALLRDANAGAVEGQQLQVALQRPDGLEFDRRKVSDQGGMFAVEFELPSNAMPGKWQVTAHSVAPGAAGQNGEADATLVGRATLQVEDIASARLVLDVEADRPRLGSDGKATLSIAAAYPDDTPGTSLPGELYALVRPAEAPFRQFPGYRFGLVQEAPQPVRVNLPGFSTGPEGAAHVAVDVPVKPDPGHPVEVAFKATVVDIGGRPVSRELVLPAGGLPFAIGIKPRFAGDAVPEGATAGFDVIAVGPSGNRIARSGLSFELYEENLDYSWFEADGRWDYKTIVSDKRLTGGGVDIAAGEPASVEETVGTGRYRLEVFDAATGVASSLRFQSGWWVAPRVGEMPDRVEVVTVARRYKPGEQAEVFVKPPYDSTVLVTVADRGVRQTLTRAIPAAGAVVEVPVAAEWTGGAYVIATAFAPGERATSTPPRRAVGVAWVGIDESGRTLGVRLAPPKKVAPRQKITVPVTVNGTQPGNPARVLVIATEIGVGRDPPLPDPLGWFFGRRRLSVEVRDVQGGLLETAQQAAAIAPAGERKQPVNGAALPGGIDPSAPVALASTVVNVDADGTIPVTLDVPDFHGRLRVTAIAWSAGKLGRDVAELAVEDSLQAEIHTPRFLAPDDSAQVSIRLTNLAAPKGAYQLRLTGSGSLATDKVRTDKVDLPASRTIVVTRLVKAASVGDGALKLEITGPKGFATSREVALAVRPIAERVVTRRERADLAPGRAVGLAAERGAAGLRPETMRSVLTLGPLPVPDVAGTLLTEDFFPYGSAEQTAARILPLLYLGELSRTLGLPSDELLTRRVQRDLDRLLSLQRTDGAFALWSFDGPADGWVTPFATEVLTRARDAGYRVPETAYRLAIDWLTRTSANPWIEPHDMPARAYELYALAHAKAADAGAVRVFQETSWDKLPTMLARAQVAAALALVGEVDRARDQFGRIDGARQALPGMRDYGSELRDRAAALALAAESGLVENDRLSALAEEVSNRSARVARPSVEEQAWLALAAHSMARRGPPLAVTLAGKRVESPEPIYRVLPAAPALMVANAADTPLYRTVTTVGVPVDAGPAQEKGYSLERKLFDLKGQPVRTDRLRANDLVVVVLSGRASEPRAVQGLVIDLLPAGLEIETVRLGRTAPLGELAWLKDLSAAAHVAFRDDRFVAAVDLTPEKPEFRLAYLARAVTPGQYRLPAARVEDLDAPERFARTGTGQLTITAAK